MHRRDNKGWMHELPDMLNFVFTYLKMGDEVQNDGLRPIMNKYKVSDLKNKICQHCLRLRYTGAISRASSLLPVIY